MNHQKHEMKYGITWVEIEPGNPNIDQVAKGYFIGSVDNILEFYEMERDMDRRGILELIELLEINRLI